MTLWEGAQDIVFAKGLGEQEQSVHGVKIAELLDAFVKGSYTAGQYEVLSPPIGLRGERGKGALRTITWPASPRGEGKAREGDHLAGSSW